MSFLDQTFCQSPNCKNECGRKMTDAERHGFYKLDPKCNLVSYGYFCGEPEFKEKDSNND